MKKSLMKREMTLFQRQNYTIKSVINIVIVVHVLPIKTSI